MDGGEPGLIIGTAAGVENPLARPFPRSLHISQIQRAVGASEVVVQVRMRPKPRIEHLFQLISEHLGDQPEIAFILGRERYGLLEELELGGLTRGAPYRP